MKHGRLDPRPPSLSEDELRRIPRRLRDRVESIDAALTRCLSGEDDPPAGDLLADLGGDDGPAP